MEPNNRVGPILSDEDSVAVLSCPRDLVKIGLKGAKLSSWAAAHDFALPTNLYDVAAVGENGLLARVGSEEIILECEPTNPLLTKIDSGLSAPSEQLYRIEQQSVTIELIGPTSHRIFSQICGVQIAMEPLHRIVYTRIAGVSCGIISLGEGNFRRYRIWIDYTYAHYLWETLIDISRSLDEGCVDRSRRTI